MDEFKRRHLRQNKEIVRVNSMQSFRIRELEQENRRLCNEVLELREKNAYLEFHESGMNHAQEYMDSVDNTKRALEVKVREIREMLRGLGRQNEDTSRALTLERRSRRSSVLPQSNFPQPNIAAQDGSEEEKRDMAREQRRRYNFDSPKQQYSPPVPGLSLPSPQTQFLSSNVIVEEEENSKVGWRTQQRKPKSGDSALRVNVFQGSPSSNTPDEELEENPLEMDSQPTTSITAPKLEAVRKVLEQKSVNTSLLSNDVSQDGQTSESKRTSRRGKQVNYALPSLRTKMRRDGEKVSAVEGENCRAGSESKTPQFKVEDGPTIPSPVAVAAGFKLSSQQERLRRASSLHRPIKIEDEELEAECHLQPLPPTRKSRRASVRPENLHDEEASKPNRRRSMGV